MSELNCWKCGEDLSWVTFPLRRLETCRSCEAELHVCRFCEFYDKGVAKSCREPVADEVKDKERANFCGYLVPKPNAFVAADNAQAQSHNELASLFGDEEPEQASSEEAARKGLDDLFGDS